MFLRFSPICFLISFVLCEKIYPEDAFKITFDHENRTYYGREYVGVTVTHLRKDGDPDLKQVIINTISRVKTFRRSCEDIENCEIQDSTYVKLSTGHRFFYPFENPVRIGLNTIKVKPAYIGDAFHSSFEGEGILENKNFSKAMGEFDFFKGINGYERHGMFIEIKTKDNRTQDFPIVYYNAIRGIDLSNNSTYENSLVCEQKSTIHGKEVSARVELPKNGWVYPETIPVKVTIENKSSWIVKQIIGEVVMSQTTYTRVGKKDYELERYKFKESDRVLANSTVASTEWKPKKGSKLLRSYQKNINFQNTFSQKETVRVPIQHRSTSFLHSIELTDIPLLQNRHFVKISVQLTNPSETSELDIPSSLDCEFPVTFGIVPTANTNVKFPTKTVPADKKYQAKLDGIENIVSYPSFEQLRKL
ncbi:hypothetical protein CAEBREN_17169 [Caenorhabditis brenneri]|uniref:Arrestin C-terminal-like domain-containing protein n=1 Tax=Caenorhabditis brenneri TaxID=135651 RepID=G0MQ99_CAEBE|nr:hypothetical protein CAEBREN_17169 [Caenorhabditis brenneri]